MSANSYSLHGPSVSSSIIICEFEGITKLDVVTYQQKTVYRYYFLSHYALSCDMVYMHDTINIRSIRVL